MVLGVVAQTKSNFYDRVLGRIGRLDPERLQGVVQNLARERAFLETLFNIIEDGVLVVDETGRIVYANQAAARLVGFQPAALESETIARILPELDWTKILTHDARGGAGLVRHELEINFPRPRFVRLYAAPLDGQAAGSAGVALVLHDATEARQKTVEAIESERIQALTLLAASVAHEIGNPLNALHIHLQLMERELHKGREQLGALAMPPAGAVPRRGRPPGRAFTSPPSELPATFDRLEHYLGVCKGEINRLDYIVTQFLQAIRPSPPQLKMVSLNEIVERTLALLRPELDNRGLRVKTRLARQLPIVPVDPVQMQQVLVNLIKNSMQAITRGGELTLQTSEGNDGVWLTVSDTGCGIPPEQLSRIFDPFYTTKKKGTGLGLMIVQRIVRAHGGRTELESRVGHGTTFRIWLPLHERPPRLLEAPTHD